MRSIILILVSIGIVKTYAQNNTIICELIDSINGQVIPFANAFNESERAWVHAKDDGRLNIWISGNDTIAISAIGFYDKVIILNDSISTNDILIVKLEPRVYNIGEATVYAMKPYSQFKRDVANLELPKTQLDSVSDHLTIVSKKVVQKAEYDRMVDEVFAREKGTLFMIGPSFKTKKQKNKIKLNSKVNLSLIHQKFNRKTIKKYTSLNDQEIDSFMVYCDFDDEFILESTEYEIAQAIEKRLQEYLPKKSNK